MTKHNPENERIKRKYFAYLKEAKRHSEPTIDAAAKALSRFEEFTRCLVPAFDGAFLSRGWKEALWARFYTEAPPRQRRSVERYNIVKRA